MSHVIIGIHGLSNKPAEPILADWWEKSIREGLEKNEGISSASFTFKSVYWADVLYPAPDNNPDAYRPVGPGALKTYEEGWKDSVRANVFDWVGNIVDATKEHLGVDAAADKVLEFKLKDLSRYYTETTVRTELRKRLREQILAHNDRRIMVVSHSMGTIIAYDVLRALGKEHPRLIIDHFITLGSPLGLPHVRHKIAQESPMVRTPSIVQKWSNFADKRDPVAIDTHLSGDYAANSNGVKVEDDLVCNDWGGINHKSYGYLRTPEVSKVIRSFI